jgi:hypothetical protein
MVPPSDYLKHYQYGFDGVKLPAAEEVLKHGVTRTYDAPADEVWKSCLRAAAQKQGVVAADAGDGQGPRRMIVLDGQRLIVMQQSNQGGIDFSTFMDTLLAVALVPDGPQQCKLAVAWLDPATNKPAPFPVPDCEPKANINWTPPAWKASAIRDQRLFVAKWRANDFLQNISVQLYGPPQWVARLKQQPTVARGKAPGVKVREDIGYEEIKNDYGNWCSLLLRRNRYVVQCPELVDELTATMANLKKAAGKEGSSTRIFILASPEVNAFSLPNGDIFICSGLLDMLADGNEAAAVLAHELDHYIQHDAVYKVRNAYRAQVAAMTVMITVSVAGGVAGGLMAAAPLGAMVSPGQQILSELVKQGAVYAATYGGMGMEEAIVSGYSREVELRADNNALRYMWGAGYDRKAMLSVMEKLKGIEVAAKDMKANCGSALVNCEPGMEARMAEMAQVGKELDQAK